MMFEARLPERLCYAETALAGEAHGGDQCFFLLPCSAVIARISPSRFSSRRFMRALESSVQVDMDSGI